jgi:hypothetical protein
MMSVSGRNLRFGWWSLLVFLSLGGLLETLHGFKVGWYVGLIWSGILLPLGFFLGGVVTYGGDPGLGVWLVPIAALLLFYSVLRIVLDLSKRKMATKQAR